MIYFFTDFANFPLSQSVATDSLINENPESNASFNVKEITVPKNEVYENKTEVSSPMLKKSLGFPEGSLIAVHINNVILCNTCNVILPMNENISTLLNFCEDVAVVLIGSVTSEIQKLQLLEFAREHNIVGENDCSNVPQHRLLFASTDIGLVSLVRQLQPALFISSDLACLDQLKTFQIPAVFVGDSSIPDSFCDRVHSLDGVYDLKNRNEC